MKKPFLFKAITIFTVVIFLCNIVPAGVLEALSLDKEVTTGPYRGRIRADKVIIPAGLGYIDETYAGPSGKMVFHIKDAHCNYDAQKAIYDLIDWLRERYGVRLITLEGGAGEYDLSLLEQAGPAGIKREISEEYLKNGVLSGAEYYRVMNPDEVRLKGIEDFRLYKENLSVYKSILEHKDKISEFLDVFSAILGRRVKKEMSADLKEFIEKRELFDSNRLDLGKYLAYLSRAVTSFTEFTGSYPNIIKMSKVLLAEKDLDFTEARRQRGRLVEDLTERLSYLERARFAERLILSGEGRIEERVLHELMIEKAGQVGLKKDDYPEFAKYVRYLRAYSGLDERELFAEVNDLEEHLSEVLCRTDGERELLKYSDRAGLLVKMLGLRINRDEFSRLRREIIPSDIMSFVKNGLKASEEELRTLEDNMVYLWHGISGMVRFYSLADLRDEALVRNMTGEMESSGEEICIAVTGGFHSDNLYRHLRDKGISFVSLSPSFVNAPEYTSPYLNVLTRHTAFSAGPRNAFTSTIQAPSPWTPGGMDLDLAGSVLLKIRTAIETLKRNGTKEMVIQLGENRVFICDATDYMPGLGMPDDFGKHPDDVIVDVEEITGVPVASVMDAFKAIVETESLPTFLRRRPEIEDMGEMVILLVADAREIEAIKKEQDGTVKKVTYARVYNEDTGDDRIVRQELQGMRYTDTYEYLYDISNGVLTCIYSSSKADRRSGYMDSPSVIRENNEKKYLCSKVRDLFRPGLPVVERRKRLQALIDEQKEYEAGAVAPIDFYEILDGDRAEAAKKAVRLWDVLQKCGYIDGRGILLEEFKSLDREDQMADLEELEPFKGRIFDTMKQFQRTGRCGWEWVIVRTKKGGVYVDDETLSGFKGLHIFNRTWLPAGFEPQNLAMDAALHGGREKVQEMHFDVLYMGGDKVRITLYNNWSAEERTQSLRARGDRDKLTGLYNRWYFWDSVVSRIKEALPAVVLFIDADHFKRFNDTYPGKHAFGDLILKTYAKTIRKVVSNTDTIVRWGGEEFVVMMPETDLDQGLVTAKKVIDRLREQRPKGLRDDDTLSATIGVVEIGASEDVDNLEKIMSRADAVMMEGKKMGRGRVYTFEEIQEHERTPNGIMSGKIEIKAKDVHTDITEVLEVIEGMFERLEKFVTSEKVEGKSQGEGVHNILRRMRKPRFQAILEKLRTYRAAMANEMRSDASISRISEHAKDRLRRLYFYFDRLEDEFLKITGERPATINVNRAMAAVAKVTDLTARYLTEGDREMLDPSPFGTGDGQSLMWLNKRGNIMKHPLLSGRSFELRKWNRSHELYHRRLNRDYPDAPRAAKEMAAIYLAFEEFEEIRDEHLAALLYSILPEFYLLHPEARHEAFIEGAVGYLKATSTEFFRTDSGADISAQAMAIMEDISFRNAVEKCASFDPGRSEHLAAVTSMAYIGAKRTDLLDRLDMGAFENVLLSEGVPERTGIEVCRAVSSIAANRPDLIRDSTVRAIAELSSRKMYGYDLYLAASEALTAVAKARPELMAGHFGSLRPLLQLRVVSGLLDIDALVPKDMAEGDAESIRSFLAYRVRQYILGKAVPEWVVAATSDEGDDIDDLPVDGAGGPIMTVEDLFMDGSARMLVRGVLESKYAEYLIDRVGTTVNLGLPGLKGEISSKGMMTLLEVKCSEAPYRKHNMALARMLGFENVTGTSSGEAYSYFLTPDFSDHRMEAVLIHVLRECGLTSPSGIHFFSQYVGGRAPDDVKLIQLANLILSPANYEWNAWPIDDPSSGMAVPPIAYGRDALRDNTVFTGGVLYTTDVKAGNSLFTYEKAMEEFAGKQASKQLLSWALKASSVPEGSRTDLQKRLAGVWEVFAARMTLLLEEKGLKRGLIDTAWISEEPMDGVDVNADGWSYGNDVRRAVLKDAFVGLQEARKTTDLMERTKAVLDDAVKDIEEIMASESAKRRKMKALSKLWNEMLEKVFLPPGESPEIDRGYVPMSGHMDRFLGQILDKVETGFGKEVAGNFSSKKLADNVFSSVLRALLISDAITEGMTDPDPSWVKRGKRSLSEWLARMMVRAKRFPGETRVVLYPVYDRAAYAREIAVTSEFRRRFARKDYGFDLAPMPYLAEDGDSLRKALEFAEGELGKDESARAMIFSDEDFFEKNNGRLKEVYGNRFICVKEEGSASADRFTYVDFALRSALALAVMDYFDERNDLNPDHREKLKDMIATMLAVITDSSELIAAFREDPARLINGIITIKPAERIPWEEMEARVARAKEFLKSL